MNKIISYLKYITKRDEKSFSKNVDLINDLVNANPTKSFFLFPGFCDVHVHFREPGFEYKEDINSGSLAALHGGYTSVCTMPNLNPVPDSIKNINIQIDAIKKSNKIDIYPYASITKKEEGKELVDFKKLKNKCIAFSDDGKGIDDDKVMEKAMKLAKENNVLIAMHCEDKSLSKNGYINDGEYCKKHNHIGINKESEYLAIKRDLELVKKIKCKYHVCHISCKESVDLIRKYKKLGLDITCETSMHYLLLDESMLKEDGKYKINPPLRTKADRKALIQGIKDGTIDIIATDHAPHSVEEKSKGLKGSSFGASSLDIAFPILYTYLVKKKIISLKKLLQLIVYNPIERFNLKVNGFSLWCLDEKYKISKKDFYSKGKSSPFIGTEVFGKNYLTVCFSKGEYIYGKKNRH